jgi:hypothetical protein
MMVKTEDLSSRQLVLGTEKYGSPALEYLALTYFEQIKGGLILCSSYRIIDNNQNLVP